MSDEITLKPYYSTAKDRVVRPAENVVLTRYFVLKWGKYLDPEEWRIVVTLRTLALDRGSETGHPNEVGVVVSLPELAKITKVSESTLKRRLSTKNLGNSYLGRFVSKERTRKEILDGFLRQDKNAYYVRLDDPVVPEDEGLLLKQMDEIETLVLQMQQSGALSALLAQHGLSVPGQTDPSLKGQTDPALPDQSGLALRGHTEPGSQVTRDPERSVRPGQPDPSGIRMNSLIDKDSIEARKNVNVPLSQSNIKSEPERERSRNRSRSIAELEAVATECAARLKDLDNIGYYRRRARQMFAAGKLQLMLTVLQRTELAIREKANSDPIERPGAYFNRLLEVEMVRLEIPTEHVQGDMSPHQIRKLVEESLGE